MSPLYEFLYISFFCINALAAVIASILHEKIFQELYGEGVKLWHVLLAIFFLPATICFFVFFFLVELFSFLYDLAVKATAYILSDVIREKTAERFTKMLQMKLFDVPKFLKGFVK